MNTIARAPFRRAARRPGGFTIVEVLFAIAILGVGIVGVLSLFISGINAASWAGNRSAAAMEAQSLYAQLIAYTEDVPEDNEKWGVRTYLERMKTKFFDCTNPADPPASRQYIWSTVPAEMWAHTPTATSKTPVAAPGSGEYSWQCRATNYMMDKTNPLNSQDILGAVVNPPGLVEVAIAVYKNYQPGKKPLSVYVTLLTLEYK